MSIPTFPVIDPPLKIEDSINLILASIAMEESALSHILNAEGEKLQYVLGTLGNGSGLDNAELDEILCVNKSIKSLIDSVVHNQMLLKGKMESALEALENYRNPCPKGPTGPTGPAGPAGPPGPRGATGSSCAPCTVSYLGRPNQCWYAEKPIEWLPSDCSDCCLPELSCDRKKIVLGRCGCYAVSYSIDMELPEQRCKNVAVSLRTHDCHGKKDKFICHFPAVYFCAPFLATASGILITTDNCPADLSLTLLSPSTVKILQASICVAEI